VKTAQEEYRTEQYLTSNYEVEWAVQSYIDGLWTGYECELKTLAISVTRQEGRCNVERDP